VGDDVITNHGNAKLHQGLPDGHPTHPRNLRRESRTIVHGLFGWLKK
jgi:hypothetical protein